MVGVYMGLERDEKMSDTVWVGIDVGEHGGLAVVAHDGVSVFDMPSLSRGQIDGDGFRKIAKSLLSNRDNTVIVLERLNGFGSPQSGFNLGRNSGIVEGVFSVLGFERIEYIDPVTWKAKLKLRGRGKTKEKIKALSVELASEIFPTVEIKHDGIADALLLAHYAKTHLND